MSARKKVETTPQGPPATFLDALDRAGTRPLDDDKTTAKKNYSERLSNSIAVVVADHLRKEFPGILPMPDGAGRETRVAAGAHKKFKKTDVRFSTHDAGLELLVSIKTLSFRNTSKKKDGTTVIGRYTKNMVRNDHELRAEAMEVHERFPYVVLIGMFFLPFDACDDGKDPNISSFAHSILTLRQRAGRVLPTDPLQLFERLFVALYEHSGPERGDVRFFDVALPPPRRGRPKPDSLKTLEQVTAEVVKAFGIRNRRYIEWADESSTAEVSLVSAPEEEGGDVEDDDSDT
jgi:hypothetical protein